MTNKKRILTVLRGQKPDRIPIDIWHTPEVLDSLKNRYGQQDTLVLYKRMGLDKLVWVLMDYKSDPNAQALDSQCRSNAQISKTIWGVPIKEVKTGQSVYQESVEAPLKNYDIVESLDDYPYWPDIDKFDYDMAANAAQKASQDFVVLGPWISLFEIYCQLRGLEDALMDLILKSKLAESILDRIETHQTDMMKRLFSRAADYFDLCFISDDMGSQNGLLISPELWDRFFKHRMKRWCDLIHSYGLKVFYHSDGACEPLIGRLIDAGIDVLNPIQHICPGMAMDQLKDKYGQRVIFHGGVDNQSVLPFGTPQDVRNEVKKCLQTLGRDGRGYIGCSCHNIQAGTPIDNILAMVDEFTQSAEARQ